jgi:hypothetical protein
LVAFGAFAWSVLPGLHAQIAALKREKLGLHELNVKLDAEASQATVALLEYESKDDAHFYALIDDYTELQDLHREFMQWGPMRTPRDCVRETILMEWKVPIDVTLWPTDRDAQLAHCMGNLKWAYRERMQLVEAMDAGLCGSDDRFALPPSDDSGDSLWIYPPGYEPDPDVATH